MNMPLDPPVDIAVADFGFTEQVVVDASADTLYDLISEVSNISRWSSTADQVSFEQGHSPTAGAWFRGTNERGGKRWESRSQIELADRPSTFSFVVGGLDDGVVRWCWRFTPNQDGGTTIMVNWSLLRFDPVLGSSATEVLELQDFMQDSVQTTLRALTRYLESTHSSTTKCDAATW